ncbi:MAG: hypothetical protein QXR48_00860 [Candidatus Woesearchaeota archaeon]
MLITSINEVTKEDINKYKISVLGSELVRFCIDVQHNTICFCERNDDHITAAPEQEAKSILKKHGLGDLTVFGDLGSIHGKNYRAVAEHFGYAWPENRLVAVSHSLEDIPADIRIPFFHLNAPASLLAGALLSSMATLDGNPTLGFALINHKDYCEIRPTNKVSSHPL